MSGTSSREYLNTYTLVPVAGQPGEYTISVDSGMTKVTSSDGPVLGTSSTESFSAGSTTESYSGYGVALFPNGDVGAEGPIGMNSNGTLTLYSESTLAPGTVIQLQSDEPGYANEWNISSNEPTYCFMAGTAIRTPDRRGRGGDAEGG